MCGVVEAPHYLIECRHLLPGVAVFRRLGIHGSDHSAGIGGSAPLHRQAVVAQSPLMRFVGPLGLLSRNSATSAETNQVIWFDC